MTPILWLCSCRKWQITKARAAFVAKQKPLLTKEKRKKFGISAFFVNGSPASVYYHTNLRSQLCNNVVPMIGFR